MMYVNHKTRLLTFIVVFISMLPTLLFAKDYNPELGQYSSKHRFKFDTEYSYRYPAFRFAPVRNDVVAYDRNGKSFTLSLSDTIKSGGIFSGSYAGKTGKWVSFYLVNERVSDVDSYVFVDDVKEVEEAARKSDKAKLAAREHRKAMAEKVEFNSTLWVIGGIAFVVLLIFAMSKMKGDPQGSPRFGSITNDQKTNSGNWYGLGDPSDKYKANSYGHGIPGRYGAPKKGPDGNYYHGGKNIGPKPGNQDKKRWQP